MTKLFPNLIKLSLCIGTLSLLFACTSIQPPLLPSASWQAHQAAINNFTQWQLRGRLNIRTESDSQSVTINWQQQSQDIYTINLSGTLGLGAVKIEGNNGIIKIEKSGETPLYTDTLETLSRDYLGYDFPASQLYYWIRGIPSPEASNNADILLDEQNLLKTLHQDQWRLEYDNYELQENGLVLPGKITLEHSPYRLTFSINRW